MVEFTHETLFYFIFPLVLCINKSCLTCEIHFIFHVNLSYCIIVYLLYIVYLNSIYLWNIYFTFVTLICLSLHLKYVKLYNDDVILTIYQAIQGSVFAINFHFVWNSTFLNILSLLIISFYATSAIVVLVWYHCNHSMRY